MKFCQKLIPNIRLHEKHGALGQFLIEPYVGNSFRFRKFSQIGEARKFQAWVLSNAKKRTHGRCRLKVKKIRAVLAQYKKTFDQGFQRETFFHDFSFETPVLNENGSTGKWRRRSEIKSTKKK